MAGVVPAPVLKSMFRARPASGLVALASSPDDINTAESGHLVDLGEIVSNALTRDHERSGGLKGIENEVHRLMMMMVRMAQTETNGAGKASSALLIETRVDAAAMSRRARRSVLLWLM